MNAQKCQIFGWYCVITNLVVFWWSIISLLCFAFFVKTSHNSQHCLAHEDILTDAWFSFDTEIVCVLNQNTSWLDRKMCCFKLDVVLCFCCWCAQMMFFICLVLDRCCLMSLVRSISRGYLGNYLNVSSGRGHLVTKTGMCCSHLQRNESDPLIIRVREGTLTLYSSPLKLELFLFFVNFSSTYLCLCRFTFYCSLNSVVWMWLLLYRRKKHFLTMFFQTLNLCHKELQSSLSLRFDVQDSRLHQCWRICPLLMKNVLSALPSWTVTDPGSDKHGWILGWGMNEWDDRSCCFFTGF